jgi:hypothetical protein
MYMPELSEWQIKTGGGSILFQLDENSRCLDTGWPVVRLLSSLHLPCLKHTWTTPNTMGTRVIFFKKPNICQHSTIFNDHKDPPGFHLIFTSLGIWRMHAIDVCSSQMLMCRRQNERNAVFGDSLECLFDVTAPNRSPVVALRLISIETFLTHLLQFSLVHRILRKSCLTL